MSNKLQSLRFLYRNLYHTDCVNIEEIPQSGSARKYYRLFSPEGVIPQSVIGVIGSSVEENDTFIYLTDHFNTHKLPVPRLLAISDDRICYLQTDLGNLSLYQALETGRKLGGRYNLKEKELLKRTMTQLPEMQIKGAQGLDFKKCYPVESFDKNSILFDLNYFKYCFLKPLGIDFNELKLESVFQLLAKDLIHCDNTAFMYRDFQARNIMLDAKGNPYFIDYQGGRRGPVEYDVVSFLWQASAQYPQKLRSELINVYIDALKQYVDIDVNKFRNNLKKFVLFRLLQVLGAYGFRGYFERKQYFIDSIPYAIDNIRAGLSDGFCPYPYLQSILTSIINLPQFNNPKPAAQKRKDGYRTQESPLYKSNPIDGQPTYSKYDGNGPLVVRVYSFSFHKGIPEDPSGNGGGYVFDCRSTRNPGRYEPYKKLTGLDEQVIRFLEDDGEILTFLESVYRLADMHVERYIQRGFTSLMFSFGCTGGQHRSVYGAEHLAHHIHEKFGIEVHICHREQNISSILPAVNSPTKK